MKISKINNFNIRFKSTNFDYKNDESAYTRQLIRQRLEENLGCLYLYQDQFDKQSYKEMKSKLDAKAASNLYHSNNEKPSIHKVNYSALEELNIFAHEKRKNELYSGAKLLRKSNGIKTAAEAGIKTIVSIAPDISGEYEEATKEEGLNFISIDQIGNKRLRFSSITPDKIQNGDLLKKLIRYPEEWATIDENGDVKSDVSKDVYDLQCFIDILDGKNPDYPLPIYYGCEMGCEKTSAWTTIYNILRNEDRTKPLSEDVLCKLVKFEKAEKEYYKH